MPFIPGHGDEGIGPTGGHLGVILDASGQVIALPRGTVMFIIEDPKRADGVFPLVLLKVNRKGLWFKCGCGDSECTRTVKFNAEWRGFHKDEKTRAHVRPVSQDH